VLSFVASVPSTVNEPSSGWSSSASKCMSVDLPEPLLPTMATDSPWRIRTDTPLSASKRAVPRP
jgi:hypothetical protein